MTPLKFVGRTCCRYVISFALNKFDEHSTGTLVTRSRMPCAIPVTGRRIRRVCFTKWNSEFFIPFSIKELIRTTSARVIGLDVQPSSSPVLFFCNVVVARKSSLQPRSNERTKIIDSVMLLLLNWSIKLESKGGEMDKNEIL